VAKVKVVNNNLDQNLNGNYFNNTASETIFSFGSFRVTSNFDGRKYIDYTNTLSSFVRPVTLETIGISDTQSSIIYQYATNAVLNLDKTDLNTFIRFGSAYEFLRVSVQNIITSYPGSLFVNSQISRGGNITYTNYSYDWSTNTSTFRVPVNCIVNTFSLVYNYGNTSLPNDEELKNLNLSYSKYVVWSSLYPDNNTFNIVGFTGNTTGRNYLMLKVNGNPFAKVAEVSGSTASVLDFHIKPNSFVFEEFRSLLNEYEKYIISNRESTNGFKFTLKDPTLLDDGSIIYVDTTLLWTTSDYYNIDINTPSYQRFLESLLTIGAKYDKIKTDLIARFLTPASMKAYDLTEEGKMTKLLRIYGREFDQIREFIDSLVYINTVTYNKINNIPDQLIKNMSNTFGWDYFSLVNEMELVNSFLTVDENERNLTTDLLPAEINIELWRRILMNTGYFWKSKGTRDAIKSMFLLIGIPEPFINITEYVYTVDGKINPNTVELSINDFPTNSFSYDGDGYPKAPLETSEFFFQISGDTDSGQAYLDVFRMAGFNLTRTVDNKKSWNLSGATYRIDDTTPIYYQDDSRLVINTKEVDVSLDTSRGIEYDVYDYIKKDFAINSSGYTLPYSYVNISLGVTGSQNTFPLPATYTSNKVLGDLEVRFNGILLNAPKTGTTTGITYQADYSINEVTKTFTILNGNFAENSTRRRDVIQATFIYSGGTHSISGVTVDYVVTRVKANPTGTAIPLPSYPRGDVQVTINGIALTKGTPQFIGDYIIDPNNTSSSSQIIIQNPEVISYLQANPDIQVAYVEVDGSDDISARSEIHRIDSFNSSKLYYNSLASKYVYKLNYKANNTTDIKILVDGIALEPNKDYTINALNPYEIFLPNGLRYGMVISVYYLVGGNALFNPVISDVFGVGDISQLSFLEFIDLIQKRMVNARNRKTISDFKGGWYPALLKIYVEYLKRANLPDDNPLKSNGYTFHNLYSFLSKYNAFFQRFVDQLLPATIILRRGGLLVRNSVFTKQKFMYRRGVNIYSGSSTTTDMRGNPILQYYGSDGAKFMIAQTIPAPPPPPPILFVETMSGVTISGLPVTGFYSGGKNIQGYDVLTEYGILYRELNGVWKKVSQYGSLAVDNYSLVITGLTVGTQYEYRAYIKSGIYEYFGNSMTITIPVPLATPYIETKIGTTGVNTINNTGGMNIIRYGDAEYYGMQYRELGASTADICISPTLLNLSNSSSVNNISVTGDTWNTYTTCINPLYSWITAASPIPPSPTGTINQLTVAANSGDARIGVVCYVPLYGTTKQVVINQATGLSPQNIVEMKCCTGGFAYQLSGLSCGRVDSFTPVAYNECYSTTLYWYASHPAAGIALMSCLDVYCNGNSIYSCMFSSKLAKTCSGTWGPILVKYGDDIGVRVYTDAQSITGAPSIAAITIQSVTNGVGNFVKGTTPTYMLTLKAQTDSTVVPPEL
jgi:hypothetical protein